MYKPYRTRRRYITANTSSATLDAVLAFIYRKQDLLNRCGRYADRVIDGLCELGLIKRVQNKKGTFYFSTDEAKEFKAIDFAKKFLLAYHNPEYAQDTKILVFSELLSDGKDLIDVTQAIKKGLV